MGQGQFEEITRLPAGSGAGLNLGWPCREGFAVAEEGYCAALIGGGVPLDPLLFPPLATLDHRDGNCSITGGYVYRGERYPELQGRYLRQLYRDILEREGEAAGIAYWRDQLASGLQSRADLGVAFVVSGEFLAQIAGRFAHLDPTEVRVQALYEGMLQRPADPAGFAYWVARLRDGVPIQRLVQSFLDATEYRQRFLP